MVLGAGVPALPPSNNKAGKLKSFLLYFFINFCYNIIKENKKERGVIIMIVLYIANDGTQFDDEYACLDYEWRLQHNEIKDIKIYDWDGEEIKNIFSENAYNNGWKIIIPTDEAAKQLAELGQRNGWCSWEDFEEAGIYEWNEEGWNGYFEKVG